MTTSRRAAPQDVDSIAKLWMEMMAEHGERDRRFELSEKAEGEYATYVRGVLKNPEVAVYVAEREGPIIGYVIALILENPGVFNLKRYGFIGEMVVTSADRRGGVGKLLWDKSSRWFERRGVEVAQLNVSGLNEAGKAFWESVGFEDFLEIKWCDLKNEAFE